MKEASEPAKGYVTRVHIDGAYSSADTLARYYFESAAEPLIATKCLQILNVWRPLAEIKQDPLAVADSTSIPEEDLVYVPIIHPYALGGTYVVPRNDCHRWFFVDRQKPEQVLVFKSYDSRKDIPARRTAHCSFSKPGKMDEDVRQSIELRALCFFDKIVDND